MYASMQGFVHSTRLVVIAVSNAPLRDKNGKQIRKPEALNKKERAKDLNSKRAVEAVKKNLPTALSRFPEGTISGTESEIVEELIANGCLGGKKSCKTAAVNAKWLQSNPRDLAKISGALLNKMTVVRDALKHFAEDKSLGVLVEQDGDRWSVSLIEPEVKVTLDFDLYLHGEDSRDDIKRIPTSKFAKYRDDILSSY